MPLNPLVNQVGAEELAKALHESCRGVTSNFTEWDDTAADIRKVFMTQATTILNAYRITIKEVPDKDQVEACAFFCASEPCGNQACGYGRPISSPHAPPIVADPEDTLP